MLTGMGLKTKDRKEEKNSLKSKVLVFLEKSFDVISTILIFALLVIIIKKLFELVIKDIMSASVMSAVENVLFILILIELFTILYAYLKNHYIKVERVVEVGIISLIREIMFKVESLDPIRVFAIASLLLVLGILFFLEKYYSNQRNKDC